MERFEIIRRDNRPIAVAVVANRLIEQLTRTAAEPLTDKDGGVESDCGCDEDGDSHAARRDGSGKSIPRSLAISFK